jgi:hypothetical protein
VRLRIETTYAVYKTNRLTSATTIDSKGYRIKFFLYLSVSGYFRYSINCGIIPSFLALNCMVESFQSRNWMLSFPTTNRVQIPYFRSLDH